MVRLNWGVRCDTGNERCWWSLGTMVGGVAAGGWRFGRAAMSVRWWLDSLEVVEGL